MQNAYKLHPLAILLLNLLYKFRKFTFEKTMRENFDFVRIHSFFLSPPSFFLSFFLPFFLSFFVSFFLSYLLSFFFSFFADKLHTKTIVCMQILHIPNDCSATGHLPFLGWGGVLATTGMLWPQNCLQRHLVRSFIDF